MKKFSFFPSLCIVLMLSQSSLSQSSTAIKTRYHPPDFPVRAMAEWEEVEGVLMAWNSTYSRLTPAFFENLAAIIHQVQIEIPVFLLCTQMKKAQNELLYHGTSISNIQFIETEGLETPWCRDYGPLSVYSEVDQSLHLIDWIYDKPHRNDDEMSIWISYYLNLPLYKAMKPPYSLMNSGANMMFDGMGLAFLNTFYRKLLSKRPECDYDKIFLKYMGVNKPLKIDLDYFHIDYFYKLINEETLLVEAIDSKLSQKSMLNLKNMNTIIKKSKSSYDQPFRIIELPVPQIVSPTAPIAEDDHPSYINSLITNNVVFVPTYQCETDAKALEIYRNAMPGYKIIGVNCAGTFRHRGAIHCLTREIGVRDPIFISHIPEREYTPNIRGFQIEAKVKSREILKTVNLFWKTDLMKKFVPLPMQQKNKDIFRAFIPSQPVGTTIYYYVQVQNKYGKSIKKPFVAPRACWKFTVKNFIKRFQ